MAGFGFAALFLAGAAFLAAGFPAFVFDAAFARDGIIFLRMALADRKRFSYGKLSPRRALGKGKSSDTWNSP